MARLFISHSSLDAVWCRPFVAALRAAGHTCFYDEDSIPGSAEWFKVIEDGVRDCDTFVLVLSPAAQASHWVNEEVRFAFVKRKAILVAVHEPAPVDGMLETRQWVQVPGMAPDAAAQVVPVSYTHLTLPTIYSV